MMIQTYFLRVYGHRFNDLHFEIQEENGKSTGNSVDFCAYKKSYHNFPEL